MRRVERRPVDTSRPAPLWRRLERGAGGVVDGGLLAAADPPRQRVAHLRRRHRAGRSEEGHRASILRVCERCQAMVPVETRRDRGGGVMRITSSTRQRHIKGHIKVSWSPRARAFYMDCRGADSTRARGDGLRRPFHRGSTHPTAPSPPGPHCAHSNTRGGRARTGQGWKRVGMQCGWSAVRESSREPSCARTLGVLPRMTGAAVGEEEDPPRSLHLPAYSSPAPLLAAPPLGTACTTDRRQDVAWRTDTAVTTDAPHARLPCSGAGGVCPYASFRGASCAHAQTCPLFPHAELTSRRTVLPRTGNRALQLLDAVQAVHTPDGRLWKDLVAPQARPLHTHAWSRTLVEGCAGCVNIPVRHSGGDVRPGRCNCRH